MTEMRGSEWRKCSCSSKEETRKDERERKQQRKTGERAAEWESHPSISKSGHLHLLASRSMCLTFAALFHYRRQWPFPTLPLSFSPAVSIPLSSVTQHLRSEGSASSICLRRQTKGERGGKKKRRWLVMLFCETFQIKTEVKSDWKPPETTVAPTHTHTAGTTTATAQLNVPLIFRSFIQHKHTDTEQTPSTWHASIA